jgi:hypothetical protein
VVIYKAEKHRIFAAKSAFFYDIALLQNLTYFFPQKTCTHCGQLINNKKVLIINALWKFSTLCGKLPFFFELSAAYFRCINLTASLLSVFDSIFLDESMSKQLQTKKLGFQNI